MRRLELGVMLQLMESVGRKPRIRTVRQVHIGRLGAVQGQGRRVVLLLTREGRGGDADRR